MITREHDADFGLAAAGAPAARQVGWFVLFLAHTNFKRKGSRDAVIR